MDERYYADGSITVEASFIIPFMVVIMYSAVLLVISLYNRVKLAADVETCLTGLCAETELPDGKEETEMVVREKLMKEVTGYVGADPARYSVNRDGDTLRVRVTVRSRFDSGPIKLFYEHFLLIVYETERKLNSRSDTLREQTALIKTIGIVKDNVEKDKQSGGE